MNLSLKIILIAAIVVYFLCIIHLLKRKRLELRYTLLWLFGGVVMLLITIFPEAFIFLMGFTGIVEPVNCVFAAVLFIMIIILMSITSIVSKLNANIRRLTQKCALYEKKIRDLEDEKNEEN